MTAIKSFVIKQVLLVKTQWMINLVITHNWQEKSIKKYLTEEICQLRDENKTKNCII